MFFPVSVNSYPYANPQSFYNEGSSIGSSPNRSPGKSP